MGTRKHLLLLSSALILLALVCRSVFFSEANIQVVGNIGSNDLAKIEAAVAQANAMRYARSRQISRIELHRDGTVEVVFRDTQLRGEIGYWLTNGPSGWFVAGVLFR